MRVFSGHYDKISVIKILAFGILSSALMSGCQSLSVGQAAKLKGNTQAYMCDEQVTINKQVIDEDTIRLDIANRIFELTQLNAPDKSQSYFSSEQGLESGQGILWVENDQQATLKTMLLDHTVKMEDYPVIYQCRLNS